MVCGIWPVQSVYVEIVCMIVHEDMFSILCINYILHSILKTAKYIGQSCVLNESSL